MAKTRNMVQILDPAEFERNKQALLHFESQMVELGGIKGVSNQLQVFYNSCPALARLFGANGHDLYLASPSKKRFEMVTQLGCDASGREYLR